LQAVVGGDALRRLWCLGALLCAGHENILPTTSSSRGGGSSSSNYKALPRDPSEVEKV
jgi:hypothetical protein